MREASAEKRITLTLQEGLAFRATTSSGHEVILDSVENAGRGNTGMRPTEALLVALGACGAMDVASMLRKMRQDLQAYEIGVTGVQRREHPRIYNSITIRHSLSGTLEEASVRRAIGLSIARYCPVFAMISPTVPIFVEYELLDSQGQVTASGTVTAEAPGIDDEA
jgi:putative redox protein